MKMILCPHSHQGTDTWSSLGCLPLREALRNHRIGRAHRLPQLPGHASLTDSAPFLDRKLLVNEPYLLMSECHEVFSNNAP